MSSERGWFVRRGRWWIITIAGLALMISAATDGQVAFSGIGALHMIAGAIVLMTDESTC
jgi:hypothetical protein